VTKHVQTLYENTMLKKSALKKHKTKYKELTQWQVLDTVVAVEITRELRQSSTYRFSDNKLLVRLPILSPEQDRTVIQQLQTALIASAKKKPIILNTLIPKKYNHGEVIWVGKYAVTIQVSFVTSKSVRGELTPDSTLKIDAPFGISDAQLSETIGTILSRLIARKALPDFSRRVHELNHTFFKKEINSISFKNVHTRWGSCSNSSNLNFSTRLLFTPDLVQDYVIIHELSHLIEMNHSTRFWNIVEAAAPNFKVQERWLKENGALCKF